MRKTTFILLALAGCATPMAEKLPPVRQRPIEQAIAEGVGYLVRTQRPNGAWGSGRGTRGFELYSMVPGSHDAFRVATTGLAVMALRDSIRTAPKDAPWLASAKEAHQRGVKNLVDRGDARRDSEDLLYNIWAHTYALQALSLELQDSGDPAVKKAAEWQLDRLIRYETVTGGWNYYDFNIGTQKPSDSPTSFGTAAGLVALWEARQAGIEVPQKLIDRALRRVEEMRNPDGGFHYAHEFKWAPAHLANRIRGSLGRTQSGHYALWTWGSKKVGEAEVREGLDVFFKDHRYIEIGRKRQWPHEAWYYTAPYYFFFGHYYAARLVEKLGGPGTRDYAEKLAATVLPYQEEDGCWWDYPMWDYDKPYGTAYALLILTRCRPDPVAAAR